MKVGQPKGRAYDVAALLMRGRLWSRKDFKSDTKVVLLMPCRDVEYAVKSFSAKSKRRSA